MVWELDELMRRLSAFSSILGRSVPVHRHYVRVENRRGWHVVEATIYAAEGITIRIFCMFFKFWRCALESDDTECRAGVCKGRLASVFADALHEAGVPNVSGTPGWKAAKALFPTNYSL